MKLLTGRAAWLALLWLVFAGLVSLIAWFCLGEASRHMDLSRALEVPSARHFFGTDPLGRDVLVRLLVGGAVSLGVSAVAVSLAILVGVLVGALAGYAGGPLDKMLMASVNVMLCFPTFFMILAVVAVLGPSLLNVMAIIGLTSWMGTARLVRAEVLSMKEREFIFAARAMGARPSRIIFSHLLPNAMGPVIVSAVLGLSSAVLTETGLSFLGMGVQPPTPSWGNILTDGKSVLGVAWWLTFFPGVAIFLTVLSANVLGEELQERLKGVRKYGPA